MAMKETVTSIRGYLGLIGVIGTVYGVLWLATSALDTAGLIGAVFHLFLGLGFLYSSFKFPDLVKTSTKFVQNLLLITGVFSILHLISSALLHIYDYRLIPPILGIMIAWYLYLNVRRLEEEHGLEDFEK